MHSLEINYSSVIGLQLGNVLIAFTRVIHPRLRHPGVSDRMSIRINDSDSPIRSGKVDGKKWGYHTDQH